MKKALFVAALSLWAWVAADARLISAPEALKAAFPSADFKQTMLFLTDAEMQEASKIAGAKIPSALIAHYDAIEAGKIVGGAYLDTHVVRTKKESLLVLLNAEGKVIRVEVVAFL